MNTRLTVYSADWCSDCLRARRILKRAGIAYTEINTDDDGAAEARMKAVNGGSGKIPTLVFEQNGLTEVLIEPSDAELKACLKRYFPVS